MEADFACLGARRLEGGELLGDMGEGLIEDRNLMLDAEAYLGVLIERLVARLGEMRRPKGNRLVPRSGA